MANNSKNMGEIPYFITTAHPDFKRPSTEIVTGTVDGDNFKSIFLELISKIMLDRECDINTYNDYIDRVFIDSYMQEDVIQLFYFKNNEWAQFSIINDEIMPVYNKMKKSFEE